MIRFTLIITCLLTATVSVAQSGQELSEVTVTSSIIPVAPAKTGRNIVTIKGSEFARLPVNSVDELLRYVPGVEVQSRGPMGTQSDFVLRGGTFQQVLVIIDGLRVNDPNSGHFTSYIPITPAQIDRIEVLKGASSALYGSDAVGGVIHIITKAFAAREQPGIQAAGQLTGGAYGLFNLNAGGTFVRHNTTIDAGIISNNATGQEQRGTKGFFNNATFSAGINQGLGSGWSLSLRSSYDVRKFAAQNFYTSFLSDTANEKVTTSWNQARLAHDGLKGKFSWHTGFKSVDDTYQYSSISTANKSRSRLLQSIATYELALAKSTFVLAGLQTQYKTISSNDRGDHSVTQAAGFMVVRQQVGEKLTISPALRLDWDSRSGAELIPQINVSYASGNFQLRGSAGKTIRQADFTERYNNYNKTIVKSGRIGNPDLEAERSVSYEAGADYWLPEAGLKFSATLFQQRFSKLIDYVVTPYAEMPRQSNLVPGATYALAKNIADVITTGGELDVLLRRGLENGRSIFGSTGLIILDSSLPGSAPSLYLSSHAKVMTNYTVGFSSRRMSLSVTGIYKTRKAQRDTTIMATVDQHYFVMNAKVEYSVYRNKISAFVQADNIFDLKYSDLLGAQMPRRWLMGGIKIAL